MNDKRQPAMITYTDGTSDRLLTMPVGWYLEVAEGLRRDILALQIPPNMPVDVPEESEQGND